MLENIVDLVDLKLNSEKIERLLEFSKTYPIIIILVKVSPSLAHASKSLIKFDPEQVHEQGKWSSLLALNRITISLITTHTLINMFTLILINLFLHGQQSVQI
jgi:hypothetical protein